LQAFPGYDPVLVPLPKKRYLRMHLVQAGTEVSRPGQAESAAGESNSFCPLGASSKIAIHFADVLALVESFRRRDGPGSGCLKSPTEMG
jgi:hypothetical protein